MDLKTENIHLMAGDCLERMKAIPDNSVDLIVTDPPYDINTSKPGGKTRLSAGLQNLNDSLIEKNIVSGYDPRILDEMVRICKNINIYLFCNKTQLPMYMDYFVTKLDCKFDLIKWVKTNSMPTYSNQYLTDTEYCFYARKNAYCKPENYKFASTLYHAPMNVKDKKIYNHPTIKPLPLIEKLIRNSSKPGGVIFDPFMGSGTTGDAAVKNDRKFIGIEQNPEYYGTACGRIFSIDGININE